MPLTEAPLVQTFGDGKISSRITDLNEGCFCFFPKEHILINQARKDTQMEFSKPFKVVLNVNAHFFLCNVKIRQNLTSYERPVSPTSGVKKRRFSCIRTSS